jgi:hypothetical protein
MSCTGHESLDPPFRHLHSVKRSTLNPLPFFSVSRPFPLHFLYLRPPIPLPFHTRNLIYCEDEGQENLLLPSSLLSSVVNFKLGSISYPDMFYTTNDEARSSLKSLRNVDQVRGQTGVCDNRQHCSCPPPPSTERARLCLYGMADTAKVSRDAF